MNRAEGGATNLINGVSRQPPEVRLTSQLEESVNQFPTVSRGLTSRNPAMLRGIIPGALPANSTVHLIDRDAAEQYVTIIHPGGITVTDLSGVPRTVNAPGGWGYLAEAEEGDIEALTVADHTFIVNKRKEVAADSARTADLVQEALIHVVQGDYFTDYKIWVNGTLVADYGTEGGPHSDANYVRRDERGARTSVIASQLASGTSGTPEATRGSSRKNLSAELPSASWEIVRTDNVIHIRNKDNTPFSIAVGAGSETRLRAHKGTAPTLSELPRKAPHGFTIKIAGSEDTGYDDYWVRYEKGSEDAEGVWKETIAPDTRYRIQRDTMPHLLVREADGTFTFKPGEWADRKVGDEDTNPWPSFVGRRITGMSFGKNRMGFFSGESIAHSRHGEFFNFFGESVITLLDTDPVDVSIAYPEVSDILHAVPFSGEVILFTTSVPFRLAGGNDTFTQQNVNMEHLMSNRVSSKARPVAAGTRLYFVNDAASGAFVHEFVYDHQGGTKEAPCISDHVHGYIPPGATRMDADEDLKLLVLHADSEPNAVYTYKWLWVGGDKVQSAWQKWTFDAPIVGMKFYGEELILVASREATCEILSVNCHEAWEGTGPCPIFLDRQVRASGTYDPETETTEFILPYPAEGVEGISPAEDTFGAPLLETSTSGNTVTALGDYGGQEFAFGFPFESYGILSPLLHRTRNNQGGYGNAVPGMSTTVTNLSLGASNTAFLRVELERDYRKPFVYDLSAALVGTKTGKHGALVLGDLNKGVSVLSRSGDMRVRFGASGPYPYSVLSYRWSGSYHPTSY